MKDIYQRNRDSLVFWLCLTAILAIGLTALAYHLIYWMIQESV